MSYTDLARAIAQGHDIGHTAFGHAGEDEFDKICQEYFCNNIKTNLPVFDRLKNNELKDELERDFYVQRQDTRIFSHAKQSFRFLCVLEGKQLTAQTVRGIIGHVYPWAEDNWHIDQELFITRIPDSNPLKSQVTDSSEETFKILKDHNIYEAQVVKYSDFLAFSIHDLDDALRSKVLDLDLLKSLFSAEFSSKDFDQYLVGPNRYARYITEFFEVNKERIMSSQPYLEKPQEASEVLGWVRENIVKKIVYESEAVKRKQEESRRYVQGLYNIWKTNSEKIIDLFPNLVPELKTEFNTGYSNMRKFCDFSLTLTDDEIIIVYRKFYGPEQ